MAVPFIASGDASSVRWLQQAFAQAPHLDLVQAWRDQPEPDYEPASVRLGWRDDALLIFAELQDRDIWNTATKLNDRVFLLGDTFEMFLQRGGDEGYGEFHVSPDNVRMQLVFHAPVDIHHPIVQVDPNLLKTQVWKLPDANRWYIYAEIPGSAVSGAKKSLAGETWKCSFSRYDYTHGKQNPVLSSSSLHRKIDFHRVYEWSTLNFSNPPQVH